MPGYLSSRDAKSASTAAPLPVSHARRSETIRVLPAAVAKIGRGGQVTEVGRDDGRPLLEKPHC